MHLTPVGQEKARRELLAIRVVREEDGARAAATLDQRVETSLGLIVIDGNRAHGTAQSLRRAGQSLRGPVIGEEDDDDAHTAAVISWSRCANSSTVRNWHCVSFFGTDSPTTS